MNEEQLKQENEKLKDAIGNAILNLQSHIDTWEDLDFLRRSSLKRMMNKLKFALGAQELLKKIEADAEHWKRLGGK